MPLLKGLLKNTNRRKTQPWNPFLYTFYGCANSSLGSDQLLTLPKDFSPQPMSKSRGLFLTENIHCQKISLVLPLGLKFA